MSDKHKSGPWNRMREGCIGYEIRADRDDDGRKVFDVYEQFKGDSDFISSFFGIEDAKKFIREAGWKGEIYGPADEV